MLATSLVHKKYIWYTTLWCQLVFLIYSARLNILHVMMRERSSLIYAVGKLSLQVFCWTSRASPLQSCFLKSSTAHCVLEGLCYEWRNVLNVISSKTELVCHCDVAFNSCSEMEEYSRQLWEGNCIMYVNKKKCCH